MSKAMETCVVSATCMGTLINLLCLIAIVYMLLRPHANEHRLAQSETFVCVDSSRLGKSGHSGQGLVITTQEDGLTKYCAHTQDQITVLLQMIMNMQTVPKESLEMYTPTNVTVSQVSAHKRLNPPNDYPGTTNDLPTFLNNSNIILHLNGANNSPLLEHAQNVQVLSAGFHILYSGLYYVYSGIHFKPDTNHPCKHFKFQTWRHAMVKVSPNNRMYSGTLASSYHTCCDNCTHDKESSYVGGVFHLSAGDLLQVQVSGAGLVYFQKESSFFGLALAGRVE